MNKLNYSTVLLMLASASTFAMEPTSPSSEARPATDAAQASPPKPAAATAEPAVRTSSAARSDRLNLDTTVVTGNRELPKVLYIVPWKKADIGELPAQPFNTLLDEVLTPVDRDVFRREVTYYEAASNGPSGVSTPAAAPAARPEK